MVLLAVSVLVLGVLGYFFWPLVVQPLEGVWVADVETAMREVERLNAERGRVNREVHEFVTAFMTARYDGVEFILENDRYRAEHNGETKFEGSLDVRRLGNGKYELTLEIPPDSTLKVRATVTARSMWWYEGGMLHTAFRRKLF